MILCKHCGHPIEKVNVNLFDREGADYEHAFEIAEPVPGVAEIQLPTSWCGFELCDDEQFSCINCPNCGQFPFSESAGLNVEHVVHVVCFEERDVHDTDVGKIGGGETHA